MQTAERAWPRRALIGLTATFAGLVFAVQYEPRVADALDPSVATVTGVVYLDADGNGRQDDRERGVGGVQVSDGVQIARTDTDGRYSLPLDVARRTTDIVYITQPAGYALPTDEYMTPRFYRGLGQLADGASAQADFALLRDRRSRGDSFNFANVADPHVNPDLAGQIAQINATSQNLAFIQVSGDLTNNATDAEFQYYRNATAASKLPVWPAVGNHEYFGGGEPTYAGRIDNYRRYVGPEWYSFDYGNRHFVVFDNCGGAPFDEQRDWVRRDLEANAPGKRVVVLMHQPMNIPFGAPSQYDDYAALFEQYETELVLVGHEHSNDTDLEWVKGAKHIQTNSSSYTIDHSPRGFRYVHMARDSFDNPFRMYGVQRSLTVTSPAPDARVSVDALDEIQVNAYHTSDEIESVRYRLDRGGPWRDLRVSGDFTWFGPLPKAVALDTGRHTLEVEAQAAGGVRWQRTTMFRLTGGKAPRVQAGADWPQFHGDASHAGVAAGAPSPAKLGLAWIHRTPGAILTGSPVVAGGVAYVGTRDENGLDDNAVHAVDVRTGRALWRFHTDASVHGTPAVADGIVYAPTIHGTLYAIDARTGRELWRREAERPDPPLSRRAYSYYAPAVADGKVYWPYQTRHGKASSGLLTALDAKTGAAVWESPMTGATMSDGTPAVAGGIVYVGNETADRIVAYDAATGARLWVSTARLGGWQDAAPAVVGGRLFIGANNGIIARDAQSGADLWTYRSTDTSWIPQNATPSTPAVAGDTLYMGFPDGRVTALNVATGAVVWSVRLPGKPYLGGVLSAPALSGDSLYIGNNDGRVYALDRGSGATLWSYEIGAWVASAPAVSGNALLIGAWDGNLYAFSDQEMAAAPKLGTREIGPATATLHPGVAEAYRATASASGRIESLQVYVDAGSGATRLDAGVYDNDGGHPGALLAAGEVKPAQGWSTVSLDAKLVKGRRYWIAVLGSGGPLKLRNHAGAGSDRRETSRRSVLAELPEQWRTGTVYEQDGPLAAFAGR
jgi:outer membrane protein assembly factor BamB